MTIRKSSSNSAYLVWYSSLYGVSHFIMIRLQPTKIELSPKDVADACSRIERRRELQATLAYESYSSTISTPATILSQNVTHSPELERKFEQLKIRTDPTSVSGETWRRSPDVFPPPNEESSAAILEASTSSSVYREQVITQGLGSMRNEESRYASISSRSTSHYGATPINRYGSISHSLRFPSPHLPAQFSQSFDGSEDDAEGPRPSSDRIRQDGVNRPYLRASSPRTHPPEAVGIPYAPVIEDASLQLPPLPRLVEAYTQLSRHGLPRSPLYLSQQAASSSPDKDGASRAPSVGEADDTIPEDLPLPRLTGYRQRAQSYSFIESEADESMAFTGSAQLSAIHSSPPVFSNEELLESEISDGGVSDTSDPSVSSVDTEEAPGPNNHPFASPFASLDRFPLPEPQRRSSSELNFGISTRSTFGSGGPRIVVRTPSPPSHRPGFLIYDDNLPPSTQPQTPSNRHTGPFNPAFTAPAALNRAEAVRQFWRSPRRRVRDDHGESAHRSDSSEIESNQENGSMEVERSRAVRRLVQDPAVMRRMEDWEVAALHSTMDRTPPQESWPL